VAILHVPPLHTLKCYPYLASWVESLGHSPEDILEFLMTPEGYSLRWSEGKLGPKPIMQETVSASGATCIEWVDAES